MITTNYTRETLDGIREMKKEQVRAYLLEKRNGICWSEENTEKMLTLYFDQFAAKHPQLNIKTLAKNISFAFVWNAQKTA